MQQAKLAKGRTFTKPQDRLNRILEILDRDMVCAFCESYLYDELCKVMEYGEYTIEEIEKYCEEKDYGECCGDCRKCEYSPNDWLRKLNRKEET